MAKTKKETPEQKKAWEELYEYVKTKVMGYDENQSLSRDMVLRLKGLLTGKFMANKNIESNANYSYETILNTFKYCKPDIDRALRTNNWANEMHRFNYILKIIEKNINTVYMKMKQKDTVKEKIEEVDTTIANYVGVEYQSKQNNRNKEDKFADLW